MFFSKHLGALRAFIVALPCLGYPLTTLTVNTAGDTAPTTGGSGAGMSGDLRFVLNYTNQNIDTFQINFSLGTPTITLAGILPILNLTNANTITIDGSNGGSPITINGSSTYPGFLARQGTVTIQNLTIQNTIARGGGPTGPGGGGPGGGGMGAGGALFIDQAATVSCSNVTMLSNQAQGGNGGTNLALYGGGGGMFGGDGGFSSGARSSPGGGGLGGAGGNGASVFSAGGGGGGGIGPGGAGGNGGTAISATAGATGGAIGAGAGGAGGGPMFAGGASGGGGGGGTPGATAPTTPAVGGGGGGAASGPTIGNGATGGYGGGGGGGGVGAAPPGGAGGLGGFGGGGGGFGTGAFSTTNASGGFGGGAGSYAGIPGFGGGASINTASIAGGVGGGNNNTATGAGGGAGLGAGIFVRTGGTLNITGPLTISGGTVTAGGGVNAGAAASTAIFAMTGNNLNFNPGGAETVTISGTIGDDSSNTLPGGTYTAGAAAGAVLLKQGAGTLILSGTNTYAGGTTLNAGIVQVSADANLGKTGVALTFGGGTLQFTSSFTTTRPVSLTPSGTFDTTGAGVSITFNGIISGAGGSLTTSGSGNITLAQTNTYAMGTSLTGGSITLTNNVGLGTGGLSMSNGTTLIISTSSTVANPLTLAGTSTVQVGGTATLSGGSSGAGNLTKTGAGTLTLTGSSTHSGGTTISAGTLSLSGTGSLPSTGTVSVAGTFSIAGISASSTTIGNLSGAGSVLLGTKNLTTGTSGSSTFSGTISDTAAGSLTKTGTGTLTLSGSNSYTGTTAINQGTLNLSHLGALGGGGAVTAADNTTLQFGIDSLVLTNAIGLSNNDVTIDTQSFTGTISGVITGTAPGTLSKISSGTLILTGTNNYTGTFHCTGGTLQGNTASLTGPITNSAHVVFDQMSAGSYLPTLLGVGTMTVQGGGLLTLPGLAIQATATVASGGRLAVDGILNADVTVNAGGFLQGTGEIQGTLQNFGTVSPGNTSIGTLEVLGDYTQYSGSTFEVEFAPSSADLLDVTGMITIQEGATISIFPTPGDYAPLTTYLVMRASNVLSGRFSFATSSLPSFSVTPIYTLTSVFLLINLVPFQQLALDKYALIVANCLDGASPQPESDLQTVIDTLHFMTITEMENTMHQMLPSVFNDLDLGQQEALIQVRETLSRQMNGLCKTTCGHLGKWRLWTDFFSTFSDQQGKTAVPGYKSHIRGDVSGIDYECQKNSFIGLAYGYARNHQNWKENSGSSSMQQGYGALYAGGQLGNHFYAQSAAIASLDIYKTNRNILFVAEEIPPSIRTAHGSPHGFSFLSHFEMGCMLGSTPQFRPYTKGDYLFVHRPSFTEEGADSIDLAVQSHNANMLRFETGMEVLHCFSFPSIRWIPYALLGGIYEMRIGGQTETAHFTALSCPMKSEGLHPSRWLGLTEAGMSYQFCSDLLLFSADGRWEWGNGYSNLGWSVQMKFNF